MGLSNWAELLTSFVFISTFLSLCVLHSTVLSVDVRDGVVLVFVYLCLSSPFRMILMTPSTTFEAVVIAMVKSKVL